jgi:hypothetical protein
LVWFGLEIVFDFSAQVEMSAPICHVTDMIVFMFIVFLEDVIPTIPSFYKQVDDANDSYQPHESTCGTPYYRGQFGLTLSRTTGGDEDTGRGLGGGCHHSVNDNGTVGKCGR